MVFTPGNLVARGLTEIREANANQFATIAGAVLELTESHQMVLGEAVVAWGLFRLTIPAEDGDSIEVVGRFTDVSAERDGNWVYILDHASVPLPPAEPEVTEN